uniref:Uncharacterized protein n=1 Tax=Ciona savignyi TaxID=51511 RepID=H2Z426_CIOSA
MAKKAEKAEQEHEQQPEAEQPHYEQPEVQEEPEPVETQPEPVETEPEPVKTEPAPAQTYQEPVDEQEPVAAEQEPVETGQEPVETEQAPATQEATPRHETDSEEEGEYVLEAQQTNNQLVDQSVEDGHVSDDEEAAAVTPVRVAVPSPTPEQDDSTQQNEEGAQNNDETTTALADDLDEKLNVTDDVNGLDDVNETDGVRAEHHTDSHGTETVLKSDESYHEDNLITENDVMQVEDPLEQEILAATDEVPVKAAKPEPIISNGVEADGDQYTQ